MIQNGIHILGLIGGFMQDIVVPPVLWRLETVNPKSRFMQRMDG